MGTDIEKINMLEWSLVPLTQYVTKEYIHVKLLLCTLWIEMSKYLILSWIC